MVMDRVKVRVRVRFTVRRRGFPHSGIAVFLEKMKNTAIPMNGGLSSE